MKRLLLALALLAAAASCTSDSSLPTPTGKGTFRAINAIVGSPSIGFRIEERFLSNVDYKGTTGSNRFDDFFYNFNFEILFLGDLTVTRIATINLKIDANRDYYPMDRVPEFWEWLEHHGTQGTIKIAIEVYEEIKVGTDDLATWTKQDRVQESLLFDEEVDPEHVADVVNRGYAPDLRDDEIGKIVAWRVSLWAGGMEVAHQQSFLWPSSSSPSKRPRGSGRREITCATAVNPA
ncbi:MAG: DUF4411 family protein [Proteobacteria bacterium]|nr:DUF4411 family protein [Pseudomonadota bacterium]